MSLDFHDHYYDGVSSQETNENSHQSEGWNEKSLLESDEKSVNEFPLRTSFRNI